MNPGEVPMDEVFEAYYRDILEHYNIPPERISSFFNRAMLLYWYLLGEQGNVVDVGIDVDYDHYCDILNMSFVLPPCSYGQERGDLVITMEEYSANLPDHIRTEIILEIFDESLGEELEIDPELTPELETISIEATFLNIGQLFFPCKLVVQIDEDEKSSYYFLKYGRNGMIYEVEAMDQELSTLLGDDDTVDQINILTVTDIRDLPTAVDYINNQFEGEEAVYPSEWPIIQKSMPLDILFTLTYIARERQYRLAPNGKKVPQLIYK